MGAMTTVNAEDVRIPRHVREALARHEEVVVLSHERPVYLILNPQDRHRQPSQGRQLSEALDLLATAPLPDPGFADDMMAVLDSVGRMPADPWAHS